MIDLLRQRSRPYLFSNSLPPAVVAAALVALDLVESPEGEALRGAADATGTPLAESA